MMKRTTACFAAMMLVMMAAMMSARPVMATDAENATFSIKAGTPPAEPNPVVVNKDTTIKLEARLYRTGSQGQEEAAFNVKRQSYTISAGSDSTIKSVAGGNFTISADRHSATMNREGGNLGTTIMASTTVSFASAGDKTVSMSGSVTYNDDSVDSDNSSVTVTVVDDVQNVYLRSANAGANGVEGGTAPSAVDGTLGVSVGEVLTFTVQFRDTDYEFASVDSTTPLNSFYGKGPYDIKMTISGGAEFVNAAGQTIAAPTAIGLVPDPAKDYWVGLSNVYVHIKSFTNPITVKATLTDRQGPIPGKAGSPQDSGIPPITWTLGKRGDKIPTAMTQILPTTFGDWLTPGSLYTYKMLPRDATNPNLSLYKGQTVHESFGTASAYGFTLGDLTDAWKQNNGFTKDANGVLQPPSGLDTPDKVAAKIFSSGTNGSFAIDGQDSIQDRHPGFGGAGATGVFKDEAAADADGFGYSIPQTYSCDNKAIGTYTITRRIRVINGTPTLEVSKTGP